MRPLRLEIEGLTAFVERAVLDFTDLQLFAITGPTGAGKSTLIDAMLLALFGKVPRVGNQHGQLIAHGRDQMVVMLEFAVGDETYRIARRIRHKGATLVQLDRVTAAGPEPLAGKAREAEALVEQLLGVDYDAFTRSVVLPQGQFDEFLRGDKAQRRAILVHLLGIGHYDRMAKLCRDRHGRLQRAVDDADQRLGGELAEATPERTEQLRGELAAAEAAVAQAQQRQATLGALQQHAAAADAARRALAAAQAERGKALRQEAEASAALTQVREHDARFAGERDRLRAALDQAPLDEARLDGLQRASPLLPPLERLLRDRPGLAAEADAAAERQQRAEAQLAAATAALPELAATAAARQQDLAAATAALERERQRHAAMHLRHDLVASAPCPVCAQPVAAVPPVEPTGIDALQRRVDQAAVQLRLAEQRRRDAERQQEERAEALPQLQQAAAAAAERRDRNDAARADAHAELGAAGLDVAGDLDGDGLAALRSQLDQELAALRRRRDERAALQRELQALEAGHRDAAVRLAQANERHALLGEQLRQLGQRLAELDAAARTAAATLAAAVAASGVAELGGAGGAAPSPDLGERIGRLLLQAQQDWQTQSRRGGQLAQQLEHQQQAVARATALRRKRAQEQERADVARALQQLLRADRFQDFVLEAAVQRLCRDGSERLRALSTGRYSLRHDGGDFAIVDHWNADRARSVRTLSGGETFLASLALSLALAEGIRSFAARTGDAGSLECLFVDEGFGALDEQALEAAVSALETLQGGRRMVGVITHLEALAERLPVRVVVDNRAGRATVSVR
ncbi:MAG: AAA family ATPase [Planctomycetota bacterium]